MTDESSFQSVSPYDIKKPSWNGRGRTTEFGKGNSRPMINQSRKAFRSRNDDVKKVRYGTHDHLLTCLIYFYWQRFLSLHESFPPYQPEQRTTSLWQGMVLFKKRGDKLKNDPRTKNASESHLLPTSSLWEGHQQGAARNSIKCASLILMFPMLAEMRSQLVSSLCNRGSRKDSYP